MKILLYTTAFVLALPTSKAPPFKKYPKKLEILVIRNANTEVLIKA